MKDYVMKLLDMEGVYPDFPLQSVFGRNCFHACCAGGNKAALLVLLDTEERYNKLYQKHVQEKNSSRYSESKAYVEKEEAEKMFSFMVEENKKKVYSKEFQKQIKEATQWVINFEQELERFSKEKKEMTRYFEVQDIFGNTPLHIASFLGKADIVQALLAYGKFPRNFFVNLFLDTDTNIENKDGWRCIELRQYKSIERVTKIPLFSL